MGIDKKACAIALDTGCARSAGGCNPAASASRSTPPASNPVAGGRLLRNAGKVLLVLGSWDPARATASAELNVRPDLSEIRRETYNSRGPGRRKRRKRGLPPNCPDVSHVSTGIGSGRLGGGRVEAPARSNRVSLCKCRRPGSGVIGVLVTGFSLPRAAAPQSDPLRRSSSPAPPARRRVSSRSRRRSTCPASAMTPADVRFACREMIGHHAQALDDMALIPSRTSREEMKQLGKRIEISQEDEIKMMQTSKDRGQPAPDVHARHAHGAKLMPGMLTPEEMSGPPTPTGSSSSRPPRGEDQAPMRAR